MSQRLHVHRVTVNLLQLDDEFILVDSRGSAIRRFKHVSEITVPLSQPAINRWRWQTAIVRLSWRLQGRARSRSLEPWGRRCASLSASFRLRRLSHNNKDPPKKQSKKYRTSTWEAAATRLREQGHNRFRRYNRSGWSRWSHTVSNNQNKRKGGPYGR